MQTHSSQLFHRIRISRGRHFWSAYAQGVMTGLMGGARRSPFPFIFVPDGEWNRGYDRAVALLSRLNSRRANSALLADLAELATLAEWLKRDPQSL